MVDEIELYGEFDAQIWADQFMEIWGHRLNEVTEELMLGWFANALMTGYDKAHGDAYTQLRVMDGE